MSFQTFFSKSARHARAMCRHVEKILHHQRDILSPKAIEEVSAAVTELDATANATADKAALQPGIDNLEKVAGKWLKPYPNHAWRENIEVLLVALAVAMAVRTFFLQPFKIPTGSMQPTLYGVTSVPDFSKQRPYTAEEIDEQRRLAAALEIPSRVQRFKEWFSGISYVHLTAKEDGVFQGADNPIRFLIFSIYQRVHFGGKTYSIWFPPDYGSALLETRAGLARGQQFRKGESIVKLQVKAGDHLFVNRVTYNFRPPKRGEIIVFETRGITNLALDQQGTFYIKRLIGLGGETLRIDPAYEVHGVPNFSSDPVPVGHVVVDGIPLTASMPHFENLYTFEGVTPGSRSINYEENRYYGHASLPAPYLAPGHAFRVEKDELFVMGDNTMSSSDSRYWGGFPEHQVIGKSFFVYWPLSPRFGFGQK